MFAVNPKLKPLTVLRNLIRISEQEGSQIQAFMLPTTKQIRNYKGNSTSKDRTIEVGLIIFKLLESKKTYDFRLKFMGS